MKRMLTLLAGLVAATAMALVVVPLALGDPINGIKPSDGSCPNSSYTLVSSSNSPLDDHNQNGSICQKFNGGQGDDSYGPQYIDDTAHHPAHT
jgi:hypothetical protein